MLSLLADRTFRHLFLAQVLSLLGTGFVTISLALLAFELAGPQAGTVLGTALAIRIVAFLFGAPVAGAMASYLPRRAFGGARCDPRLCSLLAAIRYRNLADLHPHFCASSGDGSLHAGISSSNSRHCRRRASIHKGTVSGQDGCGYRLIEDYSLPPQTFDRTEIEALALGLAEVTHMGDSSLARAAISAIAKIAATLPDESEQHLFHAISQVYRPEARFSSAAHLDLIREACWKEDALIIRYADKRNAVTERSILPSLSCIRIGP